MEQAVGRLETHQPAAQHQRVLDVRQPVHHAADVGLRAHEEDAVQTHPFAFHSTRIGPAGHQKTVEGE